jgi:hypothetical protein
MFLDLSQQFVESRKSVFIKNDHFTVLPSLGLSPGVLVSPSQLANPLCVCVCVRVCVCVGVCERESVRERARARGCVGGCFALARRQSRSGAHNKSFFNERFIAPINIKTYMIVTKLFLNYNQFTTVS